MARVRSADLNGPEWTSSGQNGPFWSILVSQMLNPVRNKVILTKNGRLDHFGPVHFPTVPQPFPSYSRSHFSADCKGGRRKGAMSKKIQNRQKVSKTSSTLFDNVRAGQKTSKIIKKRQKVSQHFSTIIFARHHFSSPFWGARSHFVSEGMKLWR